MSVLVVLVLGVVATAGTALADPPIEVNPQLTEPAVLTYRFVPGRVTVRRNNVELETFIYSPMSGQSIEAEWSIAFDHRWTEQTVDAEGVGVVYQEVEVISAEILVGEEPEDATPLTELLHGLDGQLRLSPRGEVLASEPSRVELSDESWRRAALIENLQTWSDVVLPEGEVAVGDRWSAEEQSRFSSGESYTATLLSEFTFLGYADVDGVRCAAIEANYEHRLAVAPNGRLFGIDGPALGRGVGVGYHYFDASSGQLVRGTVEYGVVMRAMAMTAPVDLMMSMELEYGPPEGS